MRKSKSRLACISGVLVVCIAAVVCLFLAVLSAWRCSAGQFTRYAVAADSRRCSDIGRAILQQGGSAVDAAIAALFCTSLVNPQSMGLGGGAIFTIMDKSGKVTVISSRETVPKHFKQDLLKNCPTGFKLLPGSEWIGVPGEMKGYAKAHMLYGKLPWAQLVEPSVKLARDGFPMPEYLGQLLQYSLIKSLVENTSLCEVLCRNKTVLRPGDTLRYPKLAETLETIARHGAEAFYTGKIAHDLISDIEGAGGSLSLEDLSSFQVRVTNSQAVPLGDYTMHVPPLPAGGALLSFILNIMKGFNLMPASIHGKHKNLTLHRYIEAAKFANGQRRKIRDPSYHSENVAYLFETSFADRVRALISSESTHPASYYNVTPGADHLGTTHVSVLAEDGSAVSVTSTINHIFGSAVYSRRTGIIMNNELADFCGRADSLAAGEQPPSSMAPAILYTKDREKILVIGGSGGSMITTAMAMSILNHLWFGMSLEDAIKSKVVFVNSKNSVIFEQGFDQGLINFMSSLGHAVQSADFVLNVVNAVARERGCISAFSDARKEGCSAGY
ncbi:glutathione hydrolase 5 proenzyme isoform X1 [Electrophorus electricus]|uniref:Glutathione hydrolase n=1 Tax=Electrophorus electricus TaxID=8005 RepID=A0A4W4FWT9_ELEEL|nr:glutathione hydrolase 5 proenzyme isoform X1 [Electrophorus electricus]